MAGAACPLRSLSVRNVHPRDALGSQPGRGGIKASVGSAATVRPASAGPSQRMAAPVRTGPAWPGLTTAQSLAVASEFGVTMAVGGGTRDHRGSMVGRPIPHRHRPDADRRVRWPRVRNHRHGCALSGDPAQERARVARRADPARLALAKMGLHAKSRATKRLGTLVNVLRRSTALGLSGPTWCRSTSVVPGPSAAWHSRPWAW